MNGFVIINLGFGLYNVLNLISYYKVTKTISKLLVVCVVVNLVCAYISWR